MPRHANIIPGVQLNLRLPQDLKVKLDLELYSKSELRVPYGAYNKFFTRLLSAYLSSKVPNVTEG